MANTTKTDFLHMAKAVVVSRAHRQQKLDQAVADRESAVHGTPMDPDPVASKMAIKTLDLAIAYWTSKVELADYLADRLKDVVI